MRNSFEIIQAYHNDYSMRFPTWRERVELAVQAILRDLIEAGVELPDVEQRKKVWRELVKDAISTPVIRESTIRSLECSLDEPPTE
jgi:hypothetical protein